MKNWPTRYSNNLGLSLPEVLIALVICAIALTALIKVTISHARDTRRLVERTQAHWLADNILQQFKLGLLTRASSPNQLRAFNQIWHWRAEVTLDKTTVFIGLDKDKPMTILTAYAYQTARL